MQNGSKSNRWRIKPDLSLLQHKRTEGREEQRREGERDKNKNLCCSNRQNYAFPKQRSVRSIGPRGGSFNLREGRGP